ncbi:MAG: molybdopterin-dependent oxidoreductase [Promethearchaeota archaeon]
MVLFLSNKRRFGTCSKDCYGSCVFVSEWDDEAPEFKFKSAQALKQHPFTNGFFCVKYNHREKLIYHPHRIRKPLIRENDKGNNQFKSVSFKVALNIIASKIFQIKKNFGSTSIVAAFNSGNFGLISRFGPLRLFEKLGATITTGGICNEGGCAGLKNLFGTYSTTNPFQINNASTKLIVVWGSDLSNRNVHAYYLVKQAQKRGVKLIVIDSRKTKIAQEADIYIYTKPGTDYILAQAILKMLIDDKSVDHNFLEKHVDGHEEILLKLSELDLKEKISYLRIGFKKLRQIVDLLIEFKHYTLFNVGYGVQKDFFGGRIVQAIALIQIFLGNLGKPGTGLIYSQSDFNKEFLSNIINYITKITPSSNISEITLISLGESLASEEYKMLFIYNFNPASSLPNQNQVQKSFMRNDLFIVVLDNFLNETTKFANVVIPSKFDIETYDLISPYYIPGISINQAGPCPYEECFSNYEFFQHLAVKLGFQNDPIFGEDQKAIYTTCLSILPLEIQKSIEEKGYYLLFEHDTIPFKNLRFPTHNGKIQLQNVKFKFEMSHLKDSSLVRINEFSLITPSHEYFIHSQFAQIHPEYLEDFQKVFLCSDDIKRLGYSLGEKLRVSNKYGSSVYILGEENSLNMGTAMIYSGAPLKISNNQNVNIFISNIPEELGLSGAYNSAKVLIKKVK